MNVQHRILSFIGTALLCATTLFAQQATTGDNGTQGAQTTTQAQAETLQMVSARVSLKQSLNADKAKTGDQVRTALAYKVALKDGTELPAGTIILGTVAEDDMHFTGTSKLALRFNKVELKDGKVIPIKATIVGVYQPESQDMSGNVITPGDEERHTFNGRPDAVDEIGVVPGVDLHSKVASHNSGVLVTTSKSKHNIKLPYGSEIALAVAPQSSNAE
jgi:hypothetical protein